ncbi:hypothetical protein Ocin01_15056 [Orchesella cincta]|uniref:Uncharacterized protein n=1 Tax=Orchesella cincta TaxID=48709 RepID=A0A1D2MF64_ORCCI|nr:hypothetical protein Ocin01_15056 [Orchesella cincta]
MALIWCIPKKSLIGGYYDRSGLLIGDGNYRYIDESDGTTIFSTCS